MCIYSGQWKSSPLPSPPLASPLLKFSSNLVSSQGKVYMFDKVLKPNVTQTQVYDATAKTIVKGGRRQQLVGISQ